MLMRALTKERQSSIVCRKRLIRSCIKTKKQGIAQVISYLIEHGADVNATTTDYNETPLSKAGSREVVFIVRELLKVPEINLDINPEPKDVSDLEDAQFYVSTYCEIKDQTILI